MSTTIEMVFSMGSVQSAYKRSEFTRQLRKYKRLKLGGGKAYDRSSEWTAVVAVAINNRA
jgi:hypothetical protein